MTSLRDKTISGVFWSFLQQGGSQGISLITTIILARLLAPSDFGLIGMLAIFIAISQTLVSAGFKDALIQKKNTDEEDYSSVFWINLFVSILIYAILFFTAPLIARFYEQPILVSLLRVLSIIFVINAFSYVQKARLTKEMKFKTLMIVQLPSVVMSGIIAICMALLDFGVWSLVTLQIVMALSFTIQIWIHSKWQPLLVFNKKKARGLFSFGGNLMLSGLISAVFNNIYFIIIGKFFPVSTLGYYQNAKKLVDIPTRTVSNVLRSVTFPVFSSIQDDDKKLKNGYRKTLQQVLFWLCPLLTLAAVLAEPLFRFILTEKWLPAVPFFQILCITGIFYPLNAYNLNIINVKGRSGLFLRLSIIKRSFTTLGIILVIPYGIWPLLIFEASSAVVMYFINSFFSGKFINYPVKEQLKDILPIFLISLAIGIVVYFLVYFLSDFSDITTILIGFFIGLSLYALLVKFSNITPFNDLKKIINNRIALKKQVNA